MHVEPEPVPGTVHVKGLVGFAFDQPVNAAGQQLEVGHALDQDAQSRVVVGTEERVRPDGADRRFLCRQNDFINIALCTALKRPLIGNVRVMSEA